MSPKQLTALRLLLAKPDGLYPSEMVHLSGGRLRRGTTYVLLQRMEADGLLSATSEEPTASFDKPRTRYAVTDKGREEYQEFLSEHITSPMVLA